MSTTIRKFEGNYIDKGSIELKELRELSKCLNIKAIAERMGIHPVTAYSYLSDSEKAKKKRVPQAFVSEIMREIEIMQKQTDGLNSAIKEINKNQNHDN